MAKKDIEYVDFENLDDIKTRASEIHEELDKSLIQALSHLEEVEEKHKQILLAKKLTNSIGEDIKVLNALMKKEEMGLLEQHREKTGETFQLTPHEKRLIRQDFLVEGKVAMANLKRNLDQLKEDLNA